VKRRAFIAALGGAAAWPFVARGQDPAIPAVGFLRSASPGPFAYEAGAFRQGLEETGFVEGQNVSIEYRWAQGQSDRLPALAADLVQRQVRVIAAIGGDLTALAAKAVTTTIPIVFVNGSDPIKSGLVTSINRPGRNITGVSLFAGTVDAKRLELLHQLVPQVSVVAVLNNPLVAETEARSKALADAAKSIGLQLRFLNVSSEGDFDTAFTTIADQRIGALFVSGGPFFVSRRDKLIPLAARYEIPAIYAWRELAAAGGLMSYGTSVPESSRQAGIYVGRILKGEKAADLPVLQPTKFVFVINLKTAKTLGLTIPPSLLARADEVIE
jgi:putative tryptophan/tyrosine transport system substrate-binding protein